MQSIDYEKLDIVLYPAISLRKITKLVKKDTLDLQKLIPKMFEIMYKYNGVGLAATQIGLSYRIFVINIEQDRNKKGEKVFLNPTILAKDGEEDAGEGCLSVPGIFVNIKRAAKVKVKAMDENFEEFEIEMEGLGARAIQHETDHLDNILIIDRISPAQKIKISPFLKKMEDDYFEKIQASEDYKRAVLKHGR
ncbi:MAG: peptide deformylase [Planctomycetota bacterium]